MYRIQICERGKEGFHAGVKAVEDVRIISEKLGFDVVELKLNTEKMTVWAKVYRQLGYIYSWGKSIKNISKDTLILIQFPFALKMIGRERMLRALKKKSKGIITVIHDVEELRGYLCNSYSDKDFELILKYTNVFIVHNKKMKRYFINKGIKENRIVDLEIFDYLYNINLSKEIRFSKALVIAGNLDEKKSPYINKLGGLKGLDILLYGPNYNRELDARKSVHYKGKIAPNKLPEVLDEGFGLVWDGTSIETCDGPSGNYLKYNNPHKLSLYLAAGLPVIIWKQAAEAEFVEENGVGICVNSLYELEKLLDDISAEEYDKMCRNVKKVGKKLAHGEYMTKAIKKAIDLLGE